MYLQPLILPAIATFVAVVCCAIAIWFLNADFRIGGFKMAKYLVPLSGGLLLGVALAGLLPEVVESLGWLRGFALAALGFLLVAGLEGNAGMPLVAAVAIHAFIDGWGLVTVKMARPQFSTAVSLAILLHKIPEGLALGALLRSRSSDSRRAFLRSVAAELPTLLGGFAGFLFVPGTWLQYPLAVAAGAFLFLGGHSLLANWKSPYHDSTS